MLFVKVRGLRAPVAVSLSVLLSCLAVACGGTEQQSPIVVGSGDDVRDELVAEIYAGALRSVGADVRTETRIGDRSDYLAALDKGDVDVVPELTGELLVSFDSTSTATGADDVFVDLNKALPAGLSVTDYATAEDRQAVAVTTSGPSPTRPRRSTSHPAAALRRSSSPRPTRPRWTFWPSATAARSGPSTR
ncbi:glycine betaine ABC transporter substrate-binding protein [Rhodococcus sp. BP-266]|uniref:glycine betaine ABC transporter substrate-binding protein n=1 Tax=Rhodococcus sp. BP-266 TaxID=2739490 RepID=UPI0027E01009|nr:glycine betaine ABC transporter substrate-binding protein [Rhodococcus sp. BP-266]